MPPKRASARSASQASLKTVSTPQRTTRTRSSLRTGQENGLLDDSIDSAPRQTANTAPQEHSGSTSRKRKRATDPVPSEDIATEAQETLSKRGRQAGLGARSAGTRRRGASAQDTGNHGEPKETIEVTSPAAAEANGAESSVRASGRARKKTSKVAEMDEAQGKRTPNGTLSKPAVRRSNKQTKAIEVEDEAEEALQESQVAAPAPLSADPVPEPAAEPQSSPAQTPRRRRGRPKGATKQTPPKPAADLPFEDVPINTSISKRRKAASTAEGAALDTDQLVAAAISAERAIDPSAAHSTSPVPSQPPPLAADDDACCDATAEALGAILREPGMPAAFAALKSTALERCAGRSLTPITGLSKEYAAVRAVIHQTVAAGEGNSLLVIGSRGSGKTTLVETALAEVARDHGSDFHTVRLNGFVHTDDKVALREIWRQLGRETQGDGADGPRQQRINYADTLASLLAVLSHPAELDGAAAHGEHTAAKAVVVVLDEFEQFAAHARQTLLYNLFDVAQARKAPLAVLGLTTRLDAAEALEKRVKSRFSHRHVHLAPPRSQAAFADVLLAALAPPAPASPPDTPPALQAAWTAHAAALLQAPPLLAHLRRVFAHSKSVPQALRALLPGLAPPGVPRAAALAPAFAALAPPDSKLPPLLPALSDAELALLAAAARLDALHATDAVASFALAFDEYARLARRAAVTGASPGGVGAGARAWGRDVCLAAWEGLAEKSLLVPVVVGEGGRGGGAGTGGAADTGRAGRLWRVDVSLEEIGRAIEAWGGGGAAAREVARWCKAL